MTDFFNEVMSYNRIIKCYKENKFPNAYCLLWNKKNDDSIMSVTNKPFSLETERRKDNGK